MLQEINPVLCIVAAVFSLWSVIVGISYIRVNKKHRTNKASSAMNQRIVEENLDIFGICNQGETMDSHDVYCVPYDKIGI